MAQREETVFCDTMFYFPTTMTPAEARIEAIERARIYAIADNFGTSVDQHMSTTITNEDQRSHTSTFFMGESDVRGIWIKDVKEPLVQQEIIGEFILTRVSVKGVARERSMAEITFDVCIYNRKEDNEKPMKTVIPTSSFYQKNGTLSDFFMKFKSPIAGYMLAYFIDEQGDAYLVAPNREATDGAYIVDAETEYTFFSKHHADKTQMATDEIVVGTTKQREINQLYILFSPNKLPKAPTEPGHIIVMGNMSGTTPPFTSHKDFQKYLTRCFRDKEFQIKKLRFSIEKMN